MTTIAVPYPAPPRCFRRGQPVRLLPGEYDLARPAGGTVTLAAETVGRVGGWRYATWDGTRPESVVVYVEIA